MNSNIASYPYAKEFVKDWLAENTMRGCRFIIRAAIEQRANYQQCLEHGATWCNLAEYRKSVRMLEGVARRLVKYLPLLRAEKALYYGRSQLFNSDELMKMFESELAWQSKQRAIQYALEIMAIEALQESN